MTTEVKLKKVGEQTVIELPQEVLERLHVSAGDSVRLSETTDGVALGRVEESEHDRQMRLAQDVMKRRESMLRRLAE
ncbi:MAG: AbrB/MazE/SpoVT family DNA-binding domain-containing protein [Planctomycetota bacterium]